MASRYILLFYTSLKSHKNQLPKYVLSDHEYCLGELVARDNDRKVGKVRRLLVGEDSFPTSRFLLCRDPPIIAGDMTPPTLKTIFKCQTFSRAHVEWLILIKVHVDLCRK
jgi:hypothetical protein